MKTLIVVLVGLTGTLVSCGASQTYGAEEVREAFEQEGYVLYVPSREPPPDAASDPYGSGKPSVLLPRRGEAFFVFVGTIPDAEAVWSRYESLHGPDTFDARRGNVIVISDQGLRAVDQRRVLAALAALPDRGSPVVVAGR